MIKRMLGITTKNIEGQETWPVGGTGDGKVTASDIGKTVTLDATLPEGVLKLAGAGEEIWGFLTSVEVNEPTHNGRHVCTVLRPNQGIRYFVTSDAALVVGDYIEGAVQTAAGKPGPKYNFVGNGQFNAINGNITPVAKAAAPTKWRVISVVDATNKIFLVEAV